MHSCQTLKAFAVATLFSAVAATGACQRTPEPQPAPAPEVQAEAIHHTDRPTTVSGCLRAGEAPNTFVLTAARAEGSMETATYQLVAQADVDLRDQMREHVGQMVRVDGTLRAQQAASAQTLAAPADAGNDQPAGTAGTPMVQTRTDVTINQVTVEAITSLDEACGIDM
jgi:hypothetical protein